MQFTVMIDQVKALEWGLNAQQAMLFAVIYQVPSWARPVNVGGKTFYALSKAKIVEELPLLTDRPDTAYRMLKALELIEIIELSSTPKITLVKITEKGRTWNRSEKYPMEVGKISEVRSEKSPTNQLTINQLTKDQENPCHQQADDGIPYDKIFDSFEKILPEKSRVQVRDEKRKQKVRAFWSKSKKRQSLEWWAAYWSSIRESNFLLTTRSLGIDWFLKDDNFKKVAEGNYQNA